MNVNLKYENGWSYYHCKLLKTFPIKNVFPSALCNGSSVRKVYDRKSKIMHDHKDNRFKHLIQLYEYNENIKFP